MLIVKQTKNKQIHIHCEPSASITYTGCDEFNNICELAKKGLRDEDVGKPFDLIWHVPQSYADEQCSEIAIPEILATAVHSDSAVTGEAIAILSTVDPENVNGVYYQFIYPQERVEVTNQFGGVIAVVGATA